MIFICFFSEFITVLVQFIYVSHYFVVQHNILCSHFRTHRIYNNTMMYVKNLLIFRSLVLLCVIFSTVNACILLLWFQIVLQCVLAYLSYSPYIKELYYEDVQVFVVLLGVYMRLGCGVFSMGCS